MKHNWIGPKIKPRNSGLYIFTKSVEFNEYDKVIFRISADTRYRFYINGKYICEGPCQSGGDVKYFETVDVTEYIKPGENYLEVKVWHFVKKIWDFSFTGALRNGSPALWAEWEVISKGKSELFGTDESWGLTEEISYKFDKHISFIHLSETDGIKKFKPLECAILRQTERYLHYTTYGYKEAYPLEKSPLPQMQEDAPKQFSVVKRGERWIELDAGKNVTARVKFVLNAQEKAKVKIYYSECYYKRGQDGSLYKGKRDDSAGELYRGVFDQVILDKGEKEFSPLWWKTFRFIRIEWDKPVTIDATFNEYYYPINIVGDFSCNSQEFNKIFEVSVQTLKNCMHEIFIDCPFFEQQQYCMDTALESIFSMTLSPDYRLTKKAIKDIACSQGEDGFLAAHWPSQAPKQIIPTFSVFWILLLRNYLRYSADIDLVKSVFGTATKIIEAFESLITERGVLGKSKYWEFLDWVPEWSVRGYPKTAEDSAMSVYSMMYSYALELVKELSIAIGRDKFAEYYSERKQKLNACIKSEYFDKNKGFYKDTLKGEYSVHTAIWAILADLENGENAKKLLLSAMKNNLPRPSFSMNYFYFRALEKVGLYGEYFNEFMNDWRNMLALNCSTWCENAKNPRSDCHGWSATPIYELISCVAGIKPVGFNCDTVTIEPNFIKEISEFEAKLPFSSGIIKVEKTNDEFTVSAPSDVKMIVKIEGKTYECTNLATFKLNV